MLQNKLHMLYYTCHHFSFTTLILLRCFSLSLSALSLMIAHEINKSQWQLTNTNRHVTNKNKKKKELNMRTLHANSVHYQNHSFPLYICRGKMSASFCLAFCLCKIFSRFLVSFKSICHVVT